MQADRGRWWLAVAPVLGQTEPSPTSPLLQPDWDRNTFQTVHNHNYVHVYLCANVLRKICTYVSNSSKWHTKPGSFNLLSWTRECKKIYRLLLFIAFPLHAKIDLKMRLADEVVGRRTFKTLICSTIVKSSVLVCSKSTWWYHHYGGRRGRACNGQNLNHAESPTRTKNSTCEVNRGFVLYLYLKRSKLMVRLRNPMPMQTIWSPPSPTHTARARAHTHTHTHTHTRTHTHTHTHIHTHTHTYSYPFWSQRGGSDIEEFGLGLMGHSLSLGRKERKLHITWASD